MTNEIIKIEDKALEDAFNRLEESLKSGFILSAMKKGAETLQEETRSQLRRKLGSGATSTLRRKKPMEKGVSLVVDNPQDEVRVSILGDFRLKWFELGTPDRYTRARKRNKKRTVRQFRGRIEALNFFATARGNEERLIRTINDELTKTIEKLLK